jgi:hypothetical protein
MPEGDSRLGRTSFTTSEVGLMVTLLVLGLVVSIVGTILTYKHYFDIAKLFAGAGITLLFGAIFGGVVKLLIDNFDRRRAQRAAQIDFIGNVLSDLKGVHDRLDRGRTLLKARQSAKSYGEEMTGFIDASVALKSVERALRTDRRSVPIQTVIKQVELMDGYLRGLLEEFEVEYKKASLTQSMFEARLAKALALESPGLDYSVEALPENRPWKSLKELPCLMDFLLPVSVDEDSDGARPSNYVAEFLRPLNAASETLRAALAKEVSG